MKFVDPQVFMLAPDPYSNYTNQKEMAAYLDAIGAENWSTDVQAGNAQELIEVAGKSCYKSFAVDLNPNLTRVTKADNRKYIGRSILQNKHGSVLEHVNATFAFVGVSRIFTHELVRHRHGSYSQESLRFVRLTDLVAYYPDVFKQPFLDRVREFLRSKGIDVRSYPTEEYLRKKFTDLFFQAEDGIRDLAEELHLDDLDDFHSKKMLTSAMRRLAPEGLGTGIIMTANLRHWRHIIELRTAAGAEEEIRKVFYEVYGKLVDVFPHVFQDASVERVDGLWQVNFMHSKV